MFEWLEQEISAIKTPRFHLIEGTVDPQLREAIVQSRLPVPSSYKEFILKFGNAKLYRNARDGYRIGIFAGPREATLNNGTRTIQLGFHAGAIVYYKTESKMNTPLIFEYENGWNEEVANSFEEWLSASCRHARSKYSHEKWEEILRGPKPFTREEEELIEARRRFQWRVLNIDAEGNHILEVTNTGRCTLPVLTVGLRSKNGQLNGAIRLNIKHIGPRQTGLLKADCYKNLVPPEEIEIFSLPDAQPEDKEYYQELLPVGGH